MVEKIGYADSVPAIEDLVLAPDGSLWIQRWTHEAGTGPVDVFDPSGHYAGTLPHNVPLPLHVTSRGTVLVAERDSLDVERLLVAELVPGQDSG
jgi:hypothetical protein